MSEKRIKTRVINKHDLEINWLKATSFIPEKGELIVYDIEVDENGNALPNSVVDSSGKSLFESGRTTPYTHERLKIGNGIDYVTDLPFILDGYAYADKVINRPAKEQELVSVYKQFELYNDDYEYDPKPVYLTITQELLDYDIYFDNHPSVNGGAHIDIDGFLHDNLSFDLYIEPTDDGPTYLFKAQELYDLLESYGDPIEMLPLLKGCTITFSDMSTETYGMYYKENKIKSYYTQSDVIPIKLTYEDGTSDTYQLVSVE